MALYQTRKKLPPGLSLAGPTHTVPSSSVSFLRDLTYTDAHGRHTHDQQIIDEVLSMIHHSRAFILIDIFLFNSFPGRPEHTIRSLATEITDALIHKKQQLPGIHITLLTDPINTVYGGYTSPELSRLRKHGIQIITTNLSLLRDSNPIYSGLWRSTLQWIKPFLLLPRLPNPFDFSQSTVGLWYYLAAFNAKANHRKLIVADSTNEQGQPKVSSLVTSANFHDGSAAHSNVAIKVTDRIYEDIILSEETIASLSNTSIPPLPDNTLDASGPVQVQVLTEGKIRRSLLKLLRTATAGDQVDIIMFALSDRQVIHQLLKASERGADIRIILDPNYEAFGYAKTGLPNQPVAWELLRRSKQKIQIRWYHTHGEQCHSKMMLLHQAHSTQLLIGSANFTRRNLHDYNLELNILVQGEPTVSALHQASQEFNKIWENQGGNHYTSPYEKAPWLVALRFAQYWFQEVTGISAN